MNEHNSKIKNLVVGLLLILLPDQANSASADLVCDWTDVESAFATIDVPPAQSESELDSWFDRVAMKHWEALEPTDVFGCVTVTNQYCNTLTNYGARGLTKRFFTR